MNLEVKNVRNVPPKIQFKRFYEAITQINTFLRMRTTEVKKVAHIFEALLLFEWFCEKDTTLVSRLAQQMPLLIENIAHIKNATKTLLKVTTNTQLEAVEQTENYALLYISIAQIEHNFRRHHNAISESLDVFVLNLNDILAPFKFPTNIIIMDTNILSCFSNLIPSKYYQSRRYKIHSDYKILICKDTLNENRSSRLKHNLFDTHLLKKLNAETFSITPTEKEIAHIMPFWEHTSKAQRLIKKNGTGERTKFQESVDMKLITQSLRLSQNYKVFCMTNDSEIWGVIHYMNIKYKVFPLSIRHNKIKSD